MKFSAINVFKGKVKEVKRGTVNTEVRVQLPGGIEIASVIPTIAAENLKPVPGDEVQVIVNASSVIIAKE